MPGVIQTSTTFNNGDSVTSTKLNSITTASTFTSGAVSGAGLIVTGSGLLSLGAVSSSNMGVDSVLTASIVNLNVTTAKIADLNVTTGKIADLGITTGKIADLNVTTGKIADANVTTVKILDANITAPKLNGAQTGTAPIYGVRAWVVFDMTVDSTGASNTSNTDRKIRASGNVTSVLKNATGEVTITLTTAMPDEFYSYCGSGIGDSVNEGLLVGRPLSGAKTSSTIKLRITNSAGNAYNSTEVCVSFLR